MKKILILISIVTILVGMSFHTTLAKSYYSSKGFGQRTYFTNAQAIGLGGSLIAVPDELQINMLNPAALVYIPYTRMSGDFIHEAIWSESQDETGFSKYTNLNGISLAIPLKQQKLVTAFSITPSTQFDYEFEESGELDDYAYTKKIQAEGGLNKISFAVGFALHKKVYIGSSFNYHFGTLSKTWKLDYLSDVIWDSSDKLTRKIWGYSISGGIIVRPTPNLFLGAVYSAPYSATFQDHLWNTTTRGGITYNVTKDKTEEKEANFPAMYGVGASYVFKDKYRVACDFLYEPWSEFKVDDILIPGYNDRKRFGTGVELLPSTDMLAPYYKKMTYRMGYYYQELDFLDDAGNVVTEYGVTLGIGFPYYHTLGRVDMALRFGERGDLSQNPVKENIFQLFITVSGGEKWFVRGGQR